MNITKKLMMAAGLFFQLSNLQALTEDQSQALNDALAQLGNIKPRSMNIKDAKAAVNALNITDQSVSDSLKFYLTDEAPSAKRPAFKNTDDEMVAAINAQMNAKPAAPAQEEADHEEAAPAQEEGTDADCSAIQAQLTAAQQEAAQHKQAAQDAQAKLAALQAQLTGVRGDAASQLQNLKKRLAEVEANAAAQQADAAAKLTAAQQAGQKTTDQAKVATQAQLDEANQSKKSLQDLALKHQQAAQEAQTKLAALQAKLAEHEQAAQSAQSDSSAHKQAAEAAQAKFAALQAEMSAGDSSLQDLVAAAKDKKGAEKYVPLAQKAARSLKAAVDSIADADVKAQVIDAIKAELASQAPAAKTASKQSQNMGRLGSKKNKQRRA